MKQFGKENSFFSVVTVRLFYLVLWAAAIALFLYSPLIEVFASSKKTLNIFTWSNTFDPEFFEEFEKETGIKLHFSYYETNEELIVKLEALNGGGYDLIVPSDYGVKELISKNLLQPLDQKKVHPLLQKVNPVLLSHYFDPTNTYSLPLEWGIFGIGYDADAFDGKRPPESWSVVFDEEWLEKYQPISMVDDPKEGVMIPSLYLFGQADTLTPEQVEKVKELLFAQKKYVQVYTDMRADYLLATKNIALAVSTNAYIWEAMRVHDNIDFFVPQEGSFITIENMAIPRGTEKTELIYKFLAYLYTKEMAQHNFLKRAAFPAMTSAIEELPLEPKIRQLLAIEDHIKRMKFLSTSIPREIINDIWIALKSA